MAQTRVNFTLSILVSVPLLTEEDADPMNTSAEIVMAEEAILNNAEEDFVRLQEALTPILQGLGKARPSYSVQLTPMTTFLYPRTFSYDDLEEEGEDGEEEVS